MSIEQEADRILDRAENPWVTAVPRDVASEASFEAPECLVPVDSVQTGLEQARVVVGQVAARLADDPTAHLSKEAIAAFKTIRAADPVEYERLRINLKQVNRLIRVCALDTFTRAAGNGDGGSDSLATRLADLASELCELWHDPDGTAFASFDGEHQGTAHREHWRIDSSGFKDWLAWLCHTELAGAPASEVTKAACNVLAGKAKFDGEEHTPSMRAAKDDLGYWLDLCDEQWRAVLVTATGWRVVEQPAPRFVRTKAMRSLPSPQSGGKLSDLWPLLNVPEADRPLLLAWMLECLRSDTPFPVLELLGEQGSAKSTTQKTVRGFIDPNKVMLRGRPKGVEDVFVAAGANHVISLENLSGITPEISDALCTIATGGGAAGRKLFTNDEENIIEAHNPVMLNGIGAVVTRPDLLDRTIAICLPTIRVRMTEEEHANSLQKSAGGTMGALLTLFADTLAALPAVRIPETQRPRMADFALLGEAMHQANGHEAGEWLMLYVQHRQDAIRRTIDSSPVAVACIAFLKQNAGYQGTVKGLLDLFNARMADRNMERGDYWPKSPKGLGDALRRSAPALRQLGIHLYVYDKPKRDGVHCELRVANGFELCAGEIVEISSSPSSRRSPNLQYRAADDADQRVEFVL